MLLCASCDAPAISSVPAKLSCAESGVSVVGLSSAAILSELAKDSTDSLFVRFSCVESRLLLNKLPPLFSLSACLKLAMPKSLSPSVPQLMSKPPSFDSGCCVGSGSDSAAFPSEESQSTSKSESSKASNNEGDPELRSKSLSIVSDIQIPRSGLSSFVFIGLLPCDNKLKTSYSQRPSNTARKVKTHSFIRQKIALK